MMDNNILHEKSNQIFNDSVKWLLHSGIRIKNGHNIGAVYGWKNLNPPSYPFIYSEITGYAITSYVYIHSELAGCQEALYAAKDSASWIIQNLTMHKSSSLSLLPAGVIEISDFDLKGDLSNQIYAFDNGMILLGLLNLYKITKEKNLLIAAEKIAESLIEKFFDGSKLVAVLDRSCNTIPSNNLISDHGIKWSNVSGPYHSKLSLGLLELSCLTNNNNYAMVSDSLCKFALEFQRADGRFITNPDQENITFLHPHLYTCEGLIYSGIKNSDLNYLSAGIKGVTWAMRQINPLTGGLPRNTASRSPEQSDCTAQLLRLLIICNSQVQELMKVSSNFMDKIIEKLLHRLLDFYIAEGEDRGGIRYHLSLDTACSWCTMFTMQALRLWTKRKEFEMKNNNKHDWIKFYI
jgi:hypothetical protein